MTIKEKILAYLDYKGIKKADFFEVIDISPSSFKGVAKKSELGSDKMVNILINYPDLSVDWLLFDKGEMIVTNDCTDRIPERLCHIISEVQPLQQVNEGRNNRDIAPSINSVNEGLPLIPIEAIAGALTEERVVNANEYERYIIPNFREADFLITIFGDSMFPKYCSGDIIACQRLPLNHLFFQWNRAYVLETRQGVIVKRIKKGSDNEHILLVSDNPAYEPFELPVSEINVVALVVGIIRKE